MPALRITKRYNALSPLSGIITEEKINFESKEDGMRFLAAVAITKGIDYDILDFEWALINLGGTALQVVKS